MFDKQVRIDPGINADAALTLLRYFIAEDASDNRHSDRYHGMFYCAAIAVPNVGRVQQWFYIYQTKTTYVVREGWDVSAHAATS